jgi:hypothetical protein
MAEIFEAIRAKDLGRLERAANMGAPLNDFNAEGYTPLGLAAKIGFVKGVEYLLGLAETEANKGYVSGLSPLMISVIHDRNRTTQMLLGYPSVDTDYKDPAGNTALIYAIVKGSKDAFEVLVNDRYINIETPNKDGLTPLTIAAQDNKPLFVEALINRGADLTGTKVLSKTQVEWARGGEYDPLINRMILNKVAYGMPYNTPLSAVEITPLPALASLNIDFYPLNMKARTFLRVRELGLPFPTRLHTVAESEAFKPEFLRLVNLTRGLCKGVESHYAAAKLTRVDLYIAVTFGEPRKLAGFMYGTVYPADKEFFMDLICTRDTTKGVGSLLMKIMIKFSLIAKFEMISLDSVYDAVTFYESFGFAKDEMNNNNYINELQPMFLLLDGVDPASLAFAPAPAGAATAAPGRTRRGGARRKFRRTLKKQI